MPTQLTTGREVSQYETTDNAHRHDATCMPPGFQNDCNSRPVNDIEKARLAREYHSSTDYNSEMQVLWAIFCLVSIHQKKVTPCRLLFPKLMSEGPPKRAP